MIEKPGGCRLITQPWAASLGALREWDASYSRAGANNKAVTETASTNQVVAAEQNVFRRDDGIWTITFGGMTIRLGDGLGLKCIAYLISKSRREIDAAVLKAAVTGVAMVKPAAGMEVLDQEAIRRYKNEHDDLCEQLEEAERNNDFARQEQIQKNLDAFTQQINSATGLGGRQRKNKDHVENARISLTNAINRAIQKISDKKHFDLARHIQNSICTGRTFQYSPEVDVNWDL